MQQSQEDLIITLFNSLRSANDSERVEAESRLKTYNNADGFLISLLNTIQRSDINLGTKLQMAIYFKNGVTKRWVLNCNENDPDNANIVIATPICDDEKKAIRPILLRLLVSSEDLISKQIIESLVQIGLEEYYITWPTMMSELIGLCNQSDIMILSRVLSVIEGICRVIETVPDNDIIGHVVIHFIDDLEEFLKSAWNLLYSLLASISNVYDQCELVLTCLENIASVKKYWITVDVCKDMNTENEIENYSYINLDYWMSQFILLLDYSNPLMSCETPTPTILEDIKSTIISFCSLCVSRNGDLFTPFFDVFTKTIWSLLSHVDRSCTLKYQDMIVASLSFFSSLCSKREYRDIFNNENMMQQLIEYLIIPNCMATADIIDSFESEPAAFIKNYEEGYKTSSQRYAVAHLITSLLYHFKDTFVQYLMTAISSLLNTSLESRDCAYHLFFYRCAEFPCIMRPIRNATDVDTIMQFISSVIIPDLSSSSPLIIADALIATGLFLPYLPENLLLTILTQCTQFITNPIETVRVLAMIILERVLTHIQSHKLNSIQPESLVSMILPLTNFLLNVSLPIKQTDHYLMKAFLRVVLFMNNLILPYAKEMLTKLASILAIINQNLSNPYYIHYLFESLSAFIRISSSDQQLCSDIENYLLPTLQQYLDRNIIEFLPYIFQVYGLILYSRETISQYFMDLLPMICSEAVWKERSNQTALVFLLKIYLIKNASLFDSESKVCNLFQIFRILCIRKQSRVDAMDLLFHIFLYIPYTSYQPFLSTALEIVVAVTSKGASHALKEKVLLALSTLQILQGSNAFLPYLLQQQQQQQPTAVLSFFNALFMNGIEETDPLLKKIEIVGISQFVMNDLFYQGSMMPLAHGLILLIQTSSKDITSGSRSNTTNFLEIPVEYDAYHKLSLAKIQSVDPLPQIANPEDVAKEAAQSILQKLGDSIRPLLASLPESERSYLENRLS